MASEKEKIEELENRIAELEDFIEKLKIGNSHIIFKHNTMGDLILDHCTLEISHCTMGDVLTADLRQIEDAEERVEELFSNLEDIEERIEEAEGKVEDLEDVTACFEDYPSS